jgi:hypothetical protein
METTIFWIGTSKSGNHYLGVNYEENGFICKSFVQVTEAKASELEKGQTIEIPKAAL